MSSLRARLLVWLLAAVVFVGAVGGWTVYRNALAEADAFFDYHLRQTALILKNQPVEYYLLRPQIIAPDDAAYDFVVQVWTLDGLRVYLSHPHAVLPAITTLGFSTVTTSEGRFTVRLYDTDAPKTVANFVGLAEGTKQWTDPRSGGAVTQPRAWRS